MVDDTPRIQLSDLCLDGACFDGASLGGFAFRRVSLRSASLRRCDLRDCNLSGADLDNADLTGALVDSSTIWPDAFDWQHAGVLDATRYETLDGAQLGGSFFYRSEFEGLTVSHASFVPSASYEVRFRNCAFSGVDFRNCLFERCEMWDCSFSGCDFSEASIYGTHIRHTTFSDTVFTSAFLTGDTIFEKGPDEFIQRGAILLEPGCDLSGLTLSRRFFPREGLRGARLLRADLRGSGLSLGQLQDCDLRFCTASEELLCQHETDCREEAVTDGRLDATAGGNAEAERVSDTEIESQHVDPGGEIEMVDDERVEEEVDHSRTVDGRRILSIVSRLRSLLDHEAERDLDRWIETDGWWTS